MKTVYTKTEEVERNWWLVDAADQTLGRLSTRLATVLRGKNKPTYTPNVDCGDFVVVINADKINLSGAKWTAKKYFTHSRFFGSLKEKTAAQKLADDPEFLIHEAVRGMLPTNRLSRSVLSKLKIYKGTEHPHAAQKPNSLTFK